MDNEIEFVDVKAKYVLVVEKDALWQRLNEMGLWRKREDDTDIATGPGGERH